LPADGLELVRSGKLYAGHGILLLPYARLASARVALTS